MSARTTLQRTLLTATVPSCKLLASKCLSSTTYDFTLCSYLSYNVPFLSFQSTVPEDVLMSIAKNCAILDLNALVSETLASAQECS